MEQHQPFGEADGYSLSPSFLLPPEFKEQASREETYDDILADYESSDRHFPLLDASQSISSSTRSSRVRSSKRSSYDSSLMSSGQGSAAWSSPVRRSASSAGSVPELVQSRRARRDFDLMVDQLSEQVAGFASFGEDDIESEDNETTPPGRLSHEQTFFTTEEQEHHVQNLRTSIEGEVRASLELARRGSTHVRSPLAYHKYAASDSAAKLLASPAPAPLDPPQPSKSRNRAATASNGVRANRQPYLSLFPAPPRRTPLHSPTSPMENTSSTD
jgi:hypothetical protein